jgi:hypothetical protein
MSSAVTNLRLTYAAVRCAWSLSWTIRRALLDVLDTGQAGQAAPGREISGQARHEPGQAGRVEPGESKEFRTPGADAGLPVARPEGYRLSDWAGLAAREAGR